MKEKIRVQSISDAVALSTEPTEDGLRAIFHSLTYLAVDLLCQGFLVRGAVVKGPLYHDDSMVFGAALVRAYNFESEVAKFPRIIVVREVREDVLRFNPTLMDLLRKSDDGPMFIDVLRPVVTVGREAKITFGQPSKEDKELHGRFQLIRDRLQTRFEESMDNPRHFEKVRWFAHYWNETVAPATDYQRVLGAGLDLSPKSIR
jgi:hypothetical protein